MLRSVRSNRAEALLGALVDALPAPDPFAPVTVVVGSHLVARWLQRELALSRGIAAGVELVTFDRFVEATWAMPDTIALDKRQLAAAIASVLADDEAVARQPALVPVGGYLAAEPDRERAAPRRVQLAEHVAELAWQYAQTRPDWMPALVAGRAPNELAGDSTARWEAGLLGEALARLGATHTLLPMLPWLRRASRVPPPRTPRPVHVFGLSFLVRAQLEALTDLATTSDITVYLLDACEPLWDDVRKHTGDEPLPLALWGRAMRDTLGALVERTAGNVEDVFVHAPPCGPLASLMADVLLRKSEPEPSIDTGEPEPSIDTGEPDLSVLAAPNPRRELEVVAAELRARLDADPTLRAHDVAVWIAGDAERYLAQAPSVFEAVRVPCHLIDAPIDDRGRIGEAVLALLELPTCAMTRGDLLRVMTHPAVLARHPHVDAEDWIEWTERLGIVHGADQQAHAKTYLAQHPGRFHWDQGVRRLALGAFMTSDAPVSVEDVALLPEEVAPDQHASAATFALLARSLCGDAAWLGKHEAPLADWAEIFVQLVDSYLGRRDGDSARDVERVRSMLAGIARVDLDGRRVGFREAREHAVRRLASARSDRGEPLAAGVMVAPLAAMRAIPFRVAFVVGLDERGGFSSADRPSALDVRREPRAGDVTPRDRDRHAFLEVLLGTRERLYLSYVAQEVKTGAPLGPSAVVLELADALAPYLGAPSSREALERITQRAPLHRFGAGGGALPPAIARERWAVRTRDVLRAHLRARGHAVPEADDMVALLTPELRAALGLVEPPPPAALASRERPLSLANVRTFLESPVQAWAQAVLGLDELPDDEAIERSDEPFHVERPTRAMMLREVLATQLREGHDKVDACYDAVRLELELRGQFPVGVFGEAARVIDLRTLATWRKPLGPVALGSATRLAFGRSHSRSAELLPALELALSDGRTVTLVGQTELLVRHGDRATSVIAVFKDKGPKSMHHLRGALDHVVLAAAGLAANGHDHIIVAADGKTREVTHAPWTPADARAYLAELVGELLDHPHGYLLPFEHLVGALHGKKPSRIFGDPTGGLGFGPLERIDGLDVPRDAADIAHRRLAPLVERMDGDHGFGGGK